MKFQIAGLICAASVFALAVARPSGDIPKHPVLVKQPSPIELTTVTDVYSRAVALFGGRPVLPSAYEATLEGFADYLRAAGVQRISAVELTRPNHPAVAARLGFHNFLPPREWWLRGAALALLSERLRDVSGGPVAIRNWWRPSAYNTDPAVGGARNGDHPTANAFDLDYPSVRARVAAERYLRSLERQEPWLNLSLGLGANTTHVGIGSPRGHREWHYAGWTPAT